MFRVQHLVARSAVEAVSVGLVAPLGSVLRAKDGQTTGLTRWHRGAPVERHDAHHADCGATCAAEELRELRKMLKNTLLTT